MATSVFAPLSLFVSGLLLVGCVNAADPSALTRDQAEVVAHKLWKERAEALKSERAGEVEKRVLTFGDKTMPWLEKVFGEEPAGGRSLWISMHGGGGAPKRVNDQQWQNQIKLYQPAEGIYLAPRAPTDTWNLWHEGHIDPMFDRLIEDYVAVRGVNPDRVYLMGYSAGGDGAWQLGPRMADRWAAASMMAGHPGDASLLPLRNLPFGVFVGGMDAAYKRNTVVAEKIGELGTLQKADPDGYQHLGRVYPGLPHWMNLKDAESVPWMLAKTRHVWPKKVIWVQDDVTHTRFYWLSVEAAEAKKGAKVVAQVEGQTIRISGENLPGKLTLRLSDSLVKLDEKVTVTQGKTVLFEGKVKRTEEAIRQSLKERADPRSVATALLTVELRK